jgi:hypothetical protein
MTTTKSTVTFKSMRLPIKHPLHASKKNIKKHKAHKKGGKKNPLFSEERNYL